MMKLAITKGGKADISGLNGTDKLTPNLSEFEYEIYHSDV
jgi:hypothetical protein